MRDERIHANSTAWSEGRNALVGRAYRCAAMPDKTFSQRAALERIVDRGIESVLIPAGFARSRQLTWCRRESELTHVVALLTRRSTHDLQWGVVCREAVPFLWGREASEADIADAVMSGTPGTIRHPASCQSFRLEADNEAQECDAMVTGVADDMGVVEARLRAFHARRELREYLLLNRDRKDRRDFVVPANLPLKLYTAAVLAVIDQDACARSLAEQAVEELAGYKDDLTEARLARLTEAVRRLH